MTQTVYIPVDVKERLPDETGWYQCQYLADLKDFFWFNNNLQQFFNKDMKKAYGITHWLEKKENVHVFTEEEFEKAITYAILRNKQINNEPYFGWCNVEGCENEGANGGGCWRETGYWTVCSKHSSEYREGKPQPQMKQSAIDREKRRGADGVLVNTT